MEYHTSVSWRITNKQNSRPGRAIVGVMILPPPPQRTEFPPTQPRRDSMKGILLTDLGSGQLYFHACFPRFLINLTILFLYHPHTRLPAEIARGIVSWGLKSNRKTAQTTCPIPIAEYSGNTLVISKSPQWHEEGYFYQNSTSKSVCPSSSEKVQFLCNLM